MSNEAPFHLVSEMESALALVDKCLEQMEHCCELQKKLTKFKEYERKGDSTRTMLILAKYKSKARFMDTINTTTTGFDKTLESLEAHVKKMKWILKAKSYQCPKCYGRGILSKWKYMRDRGNVQPILRSYPCDNCNGTGKIDIPPAAETYLPFFLEMVNKIIFFQKQFQNTLTIFNIKNK